MYRLQDGEPRVRVEIHPLDVPEKHGSIDESISAMQSDQNVSPAEVSPVQNFLSGKNCLHGASILSFMTCLFIQMYFLRCFFNALLGQRLVEVRVLLRTFCRSIPHRTRWYKNDCQSW